MDVIKLLTTNAQNVPQKSAYIFKDETITCKQLRDSSFQLADSLKDLGLSKGQKVAIYLPNSLEYVYSCLAAWCCAATVVPLDFMFTMDELASCISHSEATVLIAKSKPNISWNKLKEECPALKHIILCDEQVQGRLSFQALIEKGKNTAPQSQVHPQDYAVIFYTSGTTGKPKGVLVNYRQLEAPPKAVEYFVSDIKRDDVVVCALPFSHLAGLIFIQANLYFSLTVVLMERFAPLEFLRNIQNHKVNWFWLVPSMYYALLQLKEFETFDLSSLRWICIFGAPSSPDAVRRVHQYCPHAVLFHGWGMTETNAPTTVIPSGSEKIESVGKPAPWIEVKIFDEQDKEIPQGQMGEIVVRSWAVTDGYYKDSELTAQTLRNGWLHTADLGRFDAQGYLYIVGRKKEMIKVGGEIVFEPEVEAAIHKHPDVAEAAVVGVPDKLRGEVPRAFVVLRQNAQLSAEELRYFCRQHLAHFKIPHSFEFINSLPKNRLGKIDKEKLKRNH